MTDMIEATGDSKSVAVAKTESKPDGDDVLTWLENYKQEILNKVKNGYRFFQAEISLHNGKTSKIAFCGEAIHDDKAINHTIYIENPEILADFKGLTYNKKRNAWLMEGGITSISLEEHGRVYFLKVSGVNERSDVAEMTLKALIENQQEGNGATIAWLSPQVDWVNGLNDIFESVLKHEKPNE